MDPASIALVAASAGALLAAWAWSMRRLAVSLSSSACPVCEGFGSLRAGGGVVRCDDCRGEGTLDALVPSHVPAEWAMRDDR